MLVVDLLLFPFADSAIFIIMFITFDVQSHFIVTFLFYKSKLE